MMIKHIVFWRFKAHAHGNDKATNCLIAKELLEGLKGQIPGLLKIEVGINFASGADAYDLALYSVFESRVALETYQNHPLHKEVVTFITEARTERAVVDYDLPGNFKASAVGV